MPLVETPILTAPTPAIRAIYGSTAHIGRVRPAYWWLSRCAFRRAAPVSVAPRSESKYLRDA
eukprot:3575418-Pleurochrysis_carterae.AAC.4